MRVLVVEDEQLLTDAVLRFVLRRIHRTRSFVVGTARDDEIGTTHPLRALLGDVARTNDARSLRLPPLSLTVVAELVAERPVDPVWLHRITDGNRSSSSRCSTMPGSRACQPAVESTCR